MKKETFEELVGSMKEALAHAQGKRNLRTTTLPWPPPALKGSDVKRARAALHASQAVFARYLNVSTKLVQAWETNRRVPDGPALVLLHIAAEKPALFEAIRHEKRQVRRPHEPRSARRRQRTERETASV